MAVDFTFKYKGETCKASAEFIEIDEWGEYEIEYNNQKTTIFLDDKDITDEGNLLWFQKTSVDEKPWPNDLIQAIGEKIPFIDFDPDSFIVAFKLKGVEYSAEVLKTEEGYKIISYLLPDTTMNKKSYIIKLNSGGWMIEGYGGNDQPWVTMLGKEIQKFDK